MKMLLRILMCMCAAASAHSQYIPNNGQSFQFMPLFNPAFTGVERFNDLKFSYRYQWSGFGNYSPRFINLGYATRIIEPLDLGYNALRMSDPSATDSKNMPLSKRMVHGLGANVFHSQVGILKSVGTNVNYSIHYPVGDDAHLAIGLGLLIENRNLDIGEVTVRDPDEFYNYLLNGSTSQTDFNLRAGVLLYSRGFYLGFSYLPLVYMPVAESDLEMSQPFYRGSVQAGVALRLNADVALKPGIVGLIQMDNEISIDYHVKAFFRKNIWLGLSYRDIKSGIGLVGWNFNDRLSASYSYEMSLGEFRQFNDGSHELVLSVRLKNFRKHSQYTW